MRNILLTVSYDGTDFYGWQRQDAVSSKDASGSAVACDVQNGRAAHSSNHTAKSSRTAQASRTVQGEIENALEKLHRKHVTLYGSGRTDSGVHAAGQAANFFSPIDSIPVKNYARALNSYLPYDVRVVGAQEVEENFNARYSATSRVYRYFISCEPQIHAVQTKYVWHIRKTPDIEKLNAMAELLHGEMDCASFSASGDSSLSTCRYIEGVRFFEQNAFPSGKLIVFEIEANAFLYRMVRTLCGTLITLASDSNIKSVGEAQTIFKKIIDAHDRKIALVTAPSEGLFLWQVKFDGVRRHA